MKVTIEALVIGVDRPTETLSLHAVAQAIKDRLKGGKIFTLRDVEVDVDPELFSADVVQEEKCQ